MCKCKEDGLCNNCIERHGVTPIALSPHEEESIAALSEVLPNMFRIIEDLAEERYERLEELTETSRLILERIDL